VRGTHSRYALTRERNAGRAPGTRTERGARLRRDIRASGTRFEPKLSLKALLESP